MHANTNERIKDPHEGAVKRVLKKFVELLKPRKPRPYIAVNPGRRYEKALMTERGFKSKKQLRKWQKKQRRNAKQGEKNAS